MTSPEGSSSAERDVGDVLRNAGRRSDPPEDLVRSVRAAVEAQWREVVAVRAVQRRRRVGFAVAAGVVLAGVAIWAARPLLLPHGATMASVSLSVGSVRAKTGWLGRWAAVGTHRALRVGETLATSPDGRAALALADHLSVRLDHDTRIALVDSETISIESGAVYVDSGHGTESPGALQVVTPVGAVHHVGTQYEARIVGADVRIAVREGKVEVDAGGGTTHRAAAGEQMTISSTGSVTRSSVAPYGGRWQWVLATAPSFDIEGHTLADFLSWAGRELGRDVVFASPDAEAEAARVRLSGSIGGLSPDDALAAVLPTTPMRSEMRNGQLVVSFSSAAR